MKRAYPVVAQRGRTRFGAYAPEVPGSFVVEETLRAALRRIRKTIATHLRLVEEMGDDLPEPDLKVARALARLMAADSGLPRNPGVRILTVEVGPEDAPPPAPRAEPPSAAMDMGAKRKETFVTVFGKTPDGYSGQAPDLPVCVAVGGTEEEIRSNLADAVSLHVQSMVDDSEPLPERRLTPAEALAQRSEARDGGSGPDDAAVAELVTVEVRPPSPPAQAFDALWRRACRNESAFERDRTIHAPLAAGESWSGAYAADILAACGVWHGRVAEWQYAAESGESRDELRRNLRAALARALLESVAEDGTIPLPRRTAESALADIHLRQAAGGEPPDPDESVEMIPVEITAPSAARATRIARAEQ